MASLAQPKFNVVFFQTEGGTEPALDFIKSFDAPDRSKIGFDLKTVQIGFPLGMPLCRALGDGLFELRTSLPSRKEARLLFFAHDNTLVVVSGFIKKTQKTPAYELQKAKDRLKEYRANIK